MDQKAKTLLEEVQNLSKEVLRKEVVVWEWHNKAQEIQGEYPKLKPQMNWLEVSKLLFNDTLDTMKLFYVDRRTTSMMKMDNLPSIREMIHNREGEFSIPEYRVP